MTAFGDYLGHPNLGELGTKYYHDIPAISAAYELITVAHRNPFYVSEFLEREMDDLKTPKVYWKSPQIRIPQHKPTKQHRTASPFVNSRNISCEFDEGNT